MLRNKKRFRIFILIAGIGLTSCSANKQATNPTDQKERASLEGSMKVAFDETFFTGISAKYAGDDKSAMVNFQQCLSLDPNSDAVKYELAQIYMRQGNHVKSVNLSEQIVKSAPDNQWYMENLAIAYQSAKMYARSAETYEKLIAKKPNEFNYYYELGAAYLYANNPSVAISTYENLEALTGFENSLAEQLYKLYDHQKMYAKAEAKLKELIVHNPTDVRYISMLASFYKKQGETEKAISLYENLKRDFPNDPYVKLALYEYYNDIGESERAFENLEEAFGSSDVNIDAKVGILLALIDYSDKDEEIKNEVYELLEIMSKTHPEDAKTWAIYGDFLNINNQKEKARTMFLKSIEIDSSRYQVWNQVLFIDSELNDQPAIEKHAAQCKELFPNQVLPHYFLGVAALQKEDFLTAIAELEQAKNLAYGMKELEVQITGNLGDAYYQSGNYQKAWLSYDQALRMDPSNDYVLNNYAYFLSVEGENLEQAEKMSKQTVDRNPRSATYLDTYGWILFKMEKYSEAIKYLEMAKKNSIQPSGEILEHLGDAYFKFGNIEQAVLNWKAAKSFGGGTDKLDGKILNKKM